jgi:hyperosmotically inducible protein
VLTLFLTTVMLLAGCASEGGSKSTGEYVDDAVITGKVNAAIADLVSVGAAANINVETYKGIVQLSGFTDSEATRSQSAAAAASVKGVRRVENKLSLKQ